MLTNRAGVAFGLAYVVLGVAWVAVANPAAPLLVVAWFVIVAAFGSFVPGIANQVSLARAHLAAPALVYSLESNRLGYLALVLALAGLTDLVDGTIARHFDKPSMLGGGLDPVVDGILLGAVAVGLALGGIFPLWLAAVVVVRYLLPAVVALVLLSTGRRPELRHSVSG